MFSSLYVQYQDSGKVADILNDGEYSCAAFVSSVLVLMKMLEKTSATVKSIKTNLERSDWQKVSEIQPGDVIFWENVLFENGEENEHAGFAVSDQEATSTSDKKHMVVRHHITFGVGPDGNPVRNIVGVFRYPFPAK